MPTGATRPDMLCEVCQKREATNHTTIVTGDDVSHRDLCDTCFEVSQPDDVGDFATAWQAGCKYCGGEPHIGGGDPIARLNGLSRMSVMCQPCAEEYHRFLDAKWPGFGQISITPQQIANIRESDVAAIFIEAEKHVKEWVEKRGSK